MNSANLPARRQNTRIDSVEDLASYLELSAWTVSRAINGHPGVKEETKQRIFAAMEEFGFQPNPFARGLRGRGAGLVGVCVSWLGIPIVNTKLFHLQQCMRRRHLQIVMEVSLRDPANEARVIDDFRRIRVEGVVFVHSSLTAEMSRTLLKGTPAVHVDPHESLRFTSVSVDRGRAMRLLFNHLLELGHRRFGLLGINEEEPWRWPALVAIARHHGLDPAQIFSALGPPPLPENAIQAGRQMAAAALRLPMRPTALIAIDDRVAIGCLQTLREAGVRVPEEMSVTGFDNLDLARQLHPTLTTIEQNPQELMETAASMLTHEIGLAPKQRGSANSVAIAPSLVVGESTGPAPG